MKKNDKLLILIVFIIAVVGFVSVFLIQNLMSTENATAVVTRDNIEVLHISLSDGSYTIIDENYIFMPEEDESNPTYARCFNEPYIYCIYGELGVVVIEYNANRVRVIEETSPQNICQLQGYTNSPAKPVTCLPNFVLIRVIRDDDDIDVYS